MRTKVTVAVLVVVLVFYAVLIGAKGVALIGSGSLVAAMLAAVLVAVLEFEGVLPVDDLPRRPSGRVDRASADVVFAARRVETEADPGDWRGWYRLGVASDDAGDRSRARSAVRHAIALFGQEPPAA